MRHRFDTRLACLPATLASSLLFLILPASAQVNLLVNGDFEDLTDWGAVGDPPENAPLGWRDFSGRLNGAAQQSGANAIGGSGTSAYLPADAGVATAERKEISQTIDMSGPVFRYDFDFAVEDPGGASDRSLSMSTRDGSDDGLTVSFRINGDGDLQRFAGGWETLLSDVVVFDDDVTATPLVHHFSMTVNTTNDPFYDVEVTDSNGVVHTALGVTDFRGTPVQGAGGRGIEFNTFLSSGDVLIDNVSLVNVAPDFTITIDRATGTITLTNNADPVTLAAYTLSSEVGGLDAGAWKSIAANYDVDGPNSADGGTQIGTVDPSGSWNELGTPGDFEFSEAALLNPGAPVAAGQSIDLGPGAWRRSPFEDVQAEVLLANGIIATAEVQFVGNNDAAYAVGDLDLDGDVDRDDFQNEFLPNYFADTSGLSVVQQYFAADLDGDGETRFKDFLLFNEAYVAANPGAAPLTLSVPEPSALAITALLLALGATQVRNTRHAKRYAALLVCGMLLSGSDVHAQLLVNGDFEDTTGWQFAGTEAGSQPVGWRDTGDFNPATQQFGSAAIGGSGVSAYMPAFGFDPGRYAMRQLLDEPTTPAFEVRLDFAAADPGDETMRALSGSVLRESGGTMVIYRVVDEDNDGDGDLQFFSDGWNAGVLPNSVVFSNVTGSPLVHTLDMRFDTTGNEPTFDVALTDSNGVTHEATDLTLFATTPARYAGSGGLDFNTFLSDGDYLLDNVSIENVISENALTLRVLRNSGNVLLTNATAQAVSFDGYSIVSQSGALDIGVGGWNSLADQGLAGTPENPFWFELGSRTTELAEGFLGNEGTTLLPGQSISIGQAYNPAGAEDLEFEFHVAGAPPVSLVGRVEYLDRIAGDYNGDAAITGADLLVWQRGESTNGLTSGDLAAWEANFGGPGVAAASLAFVPEPAAWLGGLLALSTAGAASRRRSTPCSA